MQFLYFDPGLGAMIIQGIGADIAGILLFSKNLVYKVKLFFGVVKNDREDFFDDIEVDESDQETKESSDKK